MYNRNLHKISKQNCLWSHWSWRNSAEIFFLDENAHFLVVTVDSCVQQQQQYTLLTEFYAFAILGLHKMLYAIIFSQEEFFCYPLQKAQFGKSGSLF